MACLLPSPHAVDGQGDKNLSLRIPDECQECVNLLPESAELSFLGVRPYTWGLPRLLWLVKTVFTCHREERSDAAISLRKVPDYPSMGIYKHAEIASASLLHKD
jgi:hypothetical protein